MHGLLVVDKPAGPTSHDVVARIRRTLREQRIGHTGTLDPMATGVLVLVIGRATRLARFIGGDKTYEAIIKLGLRTDTGDACGRPLGAPYDGPMPEPEVIATVLDEFRGTFLQRPPLISAKHIGGSRSYRLARQAGRTSDGARPDERTPTALPPLAKVTVQRLDWLSTSGDRITLRIDCSPGFYVRALADDLGERLRTGAHLAELRRTRVGEFTLEGALGLREAEESGTAASRVIPLRGLLSGFPAIVLTPEGVKRATQGRDLGPGDTVSGAWVPGAFVRMLDLSGELIGIGAHAMSALPDAQGAPGLLHPFVVLM